MISQERLKALLDYDPLTGLFTRKVSHNRWIAGSVAGFKNTDGYIDAGVDGNYYGTHRLAWLYVYGDSIEQEIDHINGDKCDNRICNLRPATKSINAQNKRAARVDSASKILGVSWHKAAKKWVAQIQVSGKKTHLGSFSEIDDAKDAYITAKRQLHIGCTI